jgi:hypothetical protein
MTVLAPIFPDLVPLFALFTQLPGKNNVKPGCQSSQPKISVRRGVGIAHLCQACRAMIRKGEHGSALILVNGPSAAHPGMRVTVE